MNMLYFWYRSFSAIGSCWAFSGYLLLCTKGAGDTLGMVEKNYKFMFYKI